MGSVPRTRCAGAALIGHKYPCLFHAAFFIISYLFCRVNRIYTFFSIGLRKVNSQSKFHCGKAVEISIRKRQKFLWEFTSDYEKTEASACVNVYVNVY